MRAWLSAFLLVWLMGCSRAVNDLVLAATASGVSRASGGCYAACPEGTRCDPKTGLCAELPCRGHCRTDEVCDTARPIPACIPANAATTIQIVPPAPPRPASDAAK